MKKLTGFLCAMVLVFCVVGTASSALTVSGDVVYDDINDITWARDLNLFTEMTYQEQIDAIELSSIGGITSWQMASCSQIDSLHEYTPEEIANAFISNYYYETSDRLSWKGRYDCYTFPSNTARFVYAVWKDVALGSYDRSPVDSYGAANSTSSLLIGAWVALYGPPPPIPIPTVSEWGMIIFFILLVGSAVLVMRRKTRQKSV